MIIDLNSNDLNERYKKTVAMYYECINHKENAFLQDELSIPFEQVKLKKASVKIVFFDTLDEIDSWEVSIDLLDESSIIGKYTYIDDDKGNVLDDILVFY
jgi:hypothetical protein